MWLAKTLRCRSKVFHPICLLLFLFSPSISCAFMSDKDISSFQKEMADKPIGERIAFWAEKFAGTPYDTDPRGEYVTKNVIVADERVDCMYLTFRAVELALSHSPEEAITVALEKRFLSKGEIGEGGNVLNYEDRFQYGEDMLDSGKWGKEITEEWGNVIEIKGSRGKDKVKIISKNSLLKGLRGSISSRLRSGDIIFFIKEPEKRIAGEIVGHMGIIRREAGKTYLIHAGGVKNKGGKVAKVRLYDYVSSMPFIGVRISRF